MKAKNILLEGYVLQIDIKGHHNIYRVMKEYDKRLKRIPKPKDFYAVMSKEDAAMKYMDMVDDAMRDATCKYPGRVEYFFVLNKDNIGEVIYRSLYCGNFGNILVAIRRIFGKMDVVSFEGDSYAIIKNAFPPEYLSYANVKFECDIRQVFNFRAVSSIRNIEVIKTSGYIFHSVSR